MTEIVNILLAGLAVLGICALAIVWEHPAIARALAVRLIRRAAGLEAARQEYRRVCEVWSGKGKGGNDRH